MYDVVNDLASPPVISNVGIFGSCVHAVISRAEPTPPPIGYLPTLVLSSPSISKDVPATAPSTRKTPLSVFVQLLDSKMMPPSVYEWPVAVATAGFALVIAEMVWAAPNVVASAICAPLGRGMDAIYGPFRVKHRLRGRTQALS